MNLIFVGNHPTQELIDLSNGRLDSFYRASETIIEGFRAQSDIHLEVITSPDIPSFPKEKLYYPEQYSVRDNALMVSSLNVPFIKHFWTAISMFSAAKKFVDKQEGLTYVIIPYMVFRHVFALRLISVFCKNVKVGLIIPDIFFHKGRVSSFINKITEKLAVRSDFFVLYTEAMAEYLGIQNKPHIIIEGFKTIQPRTTSEELCFNVVYAGTLDIKYGIERLVKMMDFISPPKIQLHIYGGGNGVEVVKKASLNDNRIKYKGIVSKSEADCAIHNAMAVINPRNSFDGEYVKFSFPSKDIDYLSSGVPSILCKLPGMPHEYYDFFIDAGMGSPQELAAAVYKVYNMTMDERNAFSKKAYDFISNRMDINKQVRGIINLLQTE